MLSARGAATVGDHARERGNRQPAGDGPLSEGTRLFPSGAAALRSPPRFLSELLSRAALVGELQRDHLGHG